MLEKVEFAVRIGKKRIIVKADQKQVVRQIVTCLNAVALFSG